MRKHENTPLLNLNIQLLGQPLDHRARAKFALKNALNPVFSASKFLGYHVLDFARIMLVTQTLTGRWLYQLFLELDRYGASPTKQIQQMWLGWPIIAMAFFTATTTKFLNHYYEKNADPVVRPLALSQPDIDAAQESYLMSKRYPAVQDYYFAAFSSSMLYLLLDAVSETGKIGYIPIGWFIATTVLVPFSAYFLGKSALPNSSNVFLYKKNHFAQLPSYPESTKIENIMNSLTGAAFGSTMMVLFWTINREIHKKTMPLETWQTVISGLFIVVTTASAYLMTKHPKLFHGSLIVSKISRDISLSYAALSGIAFHTLMHIKKCSSGPCWGGNIEPVLTSVFIPLSLAIGIFSGVMSVFRYENKHQSNLDNIHLLFNMPTYLKNTAKNAIETIREYWSNCCRTADTDPEAGSLIPMN